MICGGVDFCKTTFEKQMCEIRLAVGDLVWDLADEVRRRAGGAFLSHKIHFVN